MNNGHLLLSFWLWVVLPVSLTEPHVFVHRRQFHGLRGLALPQGVLLVLADLLGLLLF